MKMLFKMMIQEQLSVKRDCVNTSATARESLSLDWLHRTENAL